MAGWVQALILAVVTAVGTASVLVGMDKGVKRLSYANILLAIALLVYVLMWAVSSMDVIRGTVQAIGEYASMLPVLSTYNDTYNSGQWSGDWTVFYWAWTVTWAPFVGMFFARISRGRTIRSFIMAGLGLPTAFVIIWMGIYGYSAFQSDRATAPAPGQGGDLTQTIVTDGNVQAALFQHLQGTPLYTVAAVVALVVITLFFITSIDSGALVMDAMANGHEDAAPRRQSVFWAVSIGAVCAAIILTAGENGLAALQEVIIVIGLPILLITVTQAALLLQALREDAGAARPMRTRQWKQVLPVEEYRRRATEDGVDVSDFVIRPEFEVGTEPENDTHTPKTWHQQRIDAAKALVTVGLTGGIAAGRTEVGAELERLGAVVVEFDDLMGRSSCPATLCSRSSARSSARTSSARTAPWTRAPSTGSPPRARPPGCACTRSSPRRCATRRTAGPARSARTPCWWSTWPCWPRPAPDRTSTRCWPSPLPPRCASPGSWSPTT